MLPLTTLLQDVPLPPDTLAIIAAILEITAGVMGVIALTGVGKWLAERMGKEITPNQVRIVSGVAAVIVTLLAGVVSGGVPGVGPIPASGDPQEWAAWVLKSALALGLFANAVWRYVYRPEPDPAPVPEPAPVPTAARPL